jgi:hypothetical protein
MIKSENNNMKRVNIFIYHNQLGYGSSDSENLVPSCMVISQQLFLDKSSYLQPISRAKNETNYLERSKIHLSRL